MSFSNFKLTKQLQNALEEQGIETPSPIQEKAIPIILSGKDVVGIAQTGTGKTLAYLLPILRNLKYSDQRYPRVLIIVPTRELAVQVVQEIDKLTSYISIRTLHVFGGTNINTQKEKVQNGSDILVATPGRLYDLTMTGVLRLKDIKTLVIDECDEMMNLGFRPQLERILELLPTKRQSLMFSATSSEIVEEVVDQYFKDTERIIVAPSGTPLEQIDQLAYKAPNYHTKLNLLTFLLASPSVQRCFVFVRTKAMADRLHEAIGKEFPEQYGVIHSNKSQNYRLRMVDEMRSNELKGLIATDVVARGIDIDDVTHVFNFDIPEQVEQYIHRIGRTGRKELRGSAISFYTPKEEVVFRHIEAYMDKKVERFPLPAEVEYSERLLPEEEEVNIHDAPTLLGKNVVRVSSDQNHQKKEQPKRNIKPKERAMKNKRRNKRKRR